MLKRQKPAGPGATQTVERQLLVPLHIAGLACTTWQRTRAPLRPPFRSFGRPLLFLARSCLRRGLMLMPHQGKIHLGRL